MMRARTTTAMLTTSAASALMMNADTRSAKRLSPLTSKVVNESIVRDA